LPELAVVDGIRICMFYAPKEKHSRPHLHAFYGGMQASVLIDSRKLLAGSLPRPQLKQVQAWIAEHETQLLELWAKARNGQPLEGID
jgi:hypothetical protein